MTRYWSGAPPAKDKFSPLLKRYFRSNIAWTLAVSARYIQLEIARNYGGPHDGDGEGHGGQAGLYRRQDQADADRRQMGAGGVGQDLRKPQSGDRRSAG